ncbi:nicotinamide-nucleotide amidase [Wielerella bovis]|uniref:nicotinamide-nucleotide amidase n=1 Tax=Wielerella bovis TaxID=2917790 RepID=UPI0020191876|nr:nicotinamide-nucleotide amidase [Wielerella bovis]ULJ62093.1 nicotinamide-nucleotide amidase [Wielerella bovis]ULJ64322.1 nicotinamide-nucleotide amidase [Wielerella bovis]ULJ66541.1 nicotinamide-nucleotide amidase [Wielerella bovis]
MTRIEYIAAELTARKQFVTCAESCTGGLLSAALTSIPGSSAFFDRSFITYSNKAKQQMLNVNFETLRHYGAVSEEVVREMALGALINTKSDYALSISGVAGPDGGTADKPVGMVWFGFATKQRIWAKQFQFSGNREEIRHQAVQYSLAILEHYLKTSTK